MTNIKGKLKTEGIGSNQALNLLGEKFNLNSDEDVTMLELIEIVRKELKKSMLWDVVKPSLTAKQNLKIIEEVME